MGRVVTRDHDVHIDTISVCICTYEYLSERKKSKYSSLLAQW